RGVVEPECGFAHRGAVGGVEPAAGEVAVLDGGGVVPGVMLGDDHVDPVIGAEAGPGGVAGVAVDVADLLAGEQATAELPGPAVVVGDEVAGVVVDRADEAVQHAVQGVDVLVGHAAAAAERLRLLRVREQLRPVEGLFGAPHGGLAALAEPPAGEVVALVAAVHGDPAPVGPAPQGGVVVVAGLETGVEHDGAGAAGLAEPAEVHHVEVHAPAAPLPVVPAGGGDRAQQQRAGVRIHQGALVLAPAPAAVAANQSGARGARPWGDAHQLAHVLSRGGGILRSGSGRDPVGLTQRGERAGRLGGEVLPHALDRDGAAVAALAQGGEEGAQRPVALAGRATVGVGDMGVGDTSG